MELLNITPNEIIKETEKFISDNKVKEDEFVCSIVYEFSRKLPYSMYIKDEDYVPGDFLNFTPQNTNKYMFINYGNIYNKMINWGDTLKSGILLQTCLIFQKMIMGQFPNDYTLTEEDYYKWGINNMTKNENYNQSFFEILRELPNYYKKVNSAQNKTERRQALEEIYEIIKNEIGQKVGGIRRTDNINGAEVIRVTEANINYSAFRDLEMTYEFEYIYKYGINCTSFIESIKNKYNNEISEKIQKKLR